MSDQVPCKECGRVGDVEHIEALYELLAEESEARAKAEEEIQVLKRTYNQLFDSVAAVQNERDELRARVAELEKGAGRYHDNVLRHVSSEWMTEKNDNAVTTHSRMIEGVLCRWWGDGPTPDGVKLIDAAIASQKENDNE